MQWLKVRVRAAVDNPVDKVDNPAKRHFFSQSRPVVGLFAKQPVPGQVKTRMSPPLSMEQASDLYRTSLFEMVGRLHQAGFALTICYAGQRQWFEKNFPGLPLFAQQGDSLGERMTNAVRELFTFGGGPVLLSGSDSPDLPIKLVQQVIDELERVDVATIPCRDGGYAVVGLRKLTTDLFDDIPWSTENVLAATRQRCHELALQYHETQSWEDIDQPADLKKLVQRSPQSLTAQYVEKELHDLF